MRPSISAALAFSIVTPCLAATPADPVPQDFAYAMPLMTPVPATAYRVAIPLEVYRNVAHDDLRDIRVFNGRGEVVPYELEEPQPTPVSQHRELPVFPLHGDSRLKFDGLRISVQSGGTAVNVQSSPGATEPPIITGYLIDARDLGLPVSALQMHWQDGAPAFSGTLRVDSSDDLAAWRTLRSGAPVMSLRTGGAQLVQSRFELSATKARFWRLTWVGAAPAIEVSSVTAETVADQPEVEHSSLVVPGLPIDDKRKEFSFDLGARLPITGINIELPESNSVARLQLYSRVRSTDPWRPIAGGEFYRVGDTGSERQNAPVRISATYDRFWLARVNQPNGTVGSGSPKLLATWNSEDVVFLARGSGPFLLAYGSTTAGAANTTLAPLLQGVTVLRAQPGSPRSLGGTARLLPNPQKFPWRMTVLWSVLGLGVVLLAFMAYRLLRELGGSETNKT